jgi:hypothetical protein
VSKRKDDTPKIVGLLRLRECCLFTWRESRDRQKRTVVIEPNHCAQCIAELRRIGVDWQIVP